MTVATATAVPTKLKGEELLAFVKDRIGQDRDQVVREAGYVTYITDPETKEKRESLQLSRFNEAFMEANGVVLTRPKSAARSGGGNGKVAFRITVGSKGVVPVGAPYTERAGFAPGTFVLVSYDKGMITLEQDPCQEPGVFPATNENGAIGEYNTAEEPGDVSKDKKAKVAVAV